jgi:hypothetical protein
MNRHCSTASAGAAPGMSMAHARSDIATPFAGEFLFLTCMAWHPV